MDRFFRVLARNKSVFSFKNRSRTGKTDDFSSRVCEYAPERPSTLLVDVDNDCSWDTMLIEMVYIGADSNAPGRMQ